MGKTYFVALGAVLLISLNAVKAEQVPEPVAFYPLNKQFGTADVKRRSQITGIPSNVSLTTGPFNTTDGAYKFWGNEYSYIQFPNGNEMLDVQNSISLMCWVRPGGQDGPLFQYDKRYRSWGVHIWIDMGGKFFSRIVGAGRVKMVKAVESSRRLEVEKWVHVAATYNHTTGFNSIYVNGILNKTLNISTGFRIAAEGKEVRMGAIKKPTKNGFLRAAVSHMEVYNVSLNGNQIRAVMNKVLNGTPCDYHPCQNGGTCKHLQGNTYQCQCNGRYSGQNCTQAINGKSTCNEATEATEATNAQTQVVEITDEADQEAGAAKKNTEDVILLPREIASKVSRWLLTKGVSQTFFAKRVVNRSQGSFSDYITKAPNELPKTHGRAIWVTLNAFLNDPKQQAALIDEYKKVSKSRRKEIDESDKPPKKAVKRYSDLELSTLDSVFKSSNGLPERSVLERTAKLLKLEERQVSVWFNNHRRKQKQGTYKPGQYTQNQGGSSDDSGATPQ